MPKPSMEREAPGSFVFTARQRAHGWTMRRSAQLGRQDKRDGTGFDRNRRSSILFQGALRAESLPWCPGPLRECLWPDNGTAPPRRTLVLLFSSDERATTVGFPIRYPWGLPSSAEDAVSAGGWPSGLPDTQNSGPVSAGKRPSGNTCLTML